MSCAGVVWVTGRANAWRTASCKKRHWQRTPRMQGGSCAPLCRCGEGCPRNTDFLQSTVESRSATAPIKHESTPSCETQLCHTRSSVALVQNAALARCPTCCGHVVTGDPGRVDVLCRRGVGVGIGGRSGRPLRCAIVIGGEHVVWVVRSVAVPWGLVGGCRFGCVWCRCAMGIGGRRVTLVVLGAAVSCHVVSCHIVSCRVALSHVVDKSR